MKKNIPQKQKDDFLGKDNQVLFDDIRSLVEQTRTRLASTINSALVLMNWHIGKRINDEVLKNKRAEYGKEILPTRSAKLQPEYGRGFSSRNLAKMVQFAEVFADAEIVASLTQQFSWSHFVEILAIKDQLKRDFYAEMCRIERWSVRTLRSKIKGMLFERTAISRKPCTSLRLFVICQTSSIR